MDIKNKIIDLAKLFYDIVKFDYDIYLIHYEPEFKSRFFNEIGSNYSHIWQIFSRTFSGYYPIKVAEKYLAYLALYSLDQSYQKIVEYIQKNNKPNN